MGPFKQRLEQDGCGAGPVIRAYEKVGFRPVGVMRRYELGPDGTFPDEGDTDSSG